MGEERLAGEKNTDDLSNQPRVGKALKLNFHV
jgi:hypothetical protein